MTNKKTKFLIFTFIFLLSVVIVPVFHVARAEEEKKWEGLVPCGKDVYTAETKDANGIKHVAGEVKNPCDFNAFMFLIDKAVKFILFYLAVPISAIMFAYAGFLLVTAGGEAAGARTKAKEIFTNAAIGLALVAAAWLIIKTILTTLGFEGGWIGF